MHHRLLISTQEKTKVGILLKSHANAGNIAVTKDSEAAGEEPVLRPIPRDVLLLQKLNQGLRHRHSSSHIRQTH